MRRSNGLDSHTRWHLAAILAIACIGCGSPADVAPPDAGTADAAPPPGCRAVVSLADPGTVVATIEGLEDDATGSCFGFGMQPEIAGDAEFEIVASITGMMRVHLAPHSCTGIDWSLHVRATCEDASSERGCENDPDPCTDETLYLEVNAGDRVVVLVGVATAFEGALSDALADPSALDFSLDVLTYPISDELCADQIDNDDDGRVDCEDRDTCGASALCAVAEACAAALPLEPIVTGNTQNGTRYLTSFCAGLAGGGGGAPEHVYAYTAPTDGILFVHSFGETFHQVLVVQDACPQSVEHLSCSVCSVDAHRSCGLSVRQIMAAGEQRFVVVDGADALEFGNYKLVSTFFATTEVEPNDSPASATPYADGFVGSLRSPDLSDHVRVAVAGPAATLSAAIGDLGTDECQQGSGGLGYPALELLAPDGSTVLAQAQGDGESCASLQVAGLAAGTYFIRAFPPEGAAGELIYGLDVALE